MKKIILLSVACVLLLGGLVAGVIWYHSQISDEPTVPTTTQPTESVTTTAPAETTKPSVEVHIDTPMVSISLPILTESYTADNAAEIFQRTFQDVVLSLPDAAIAETVTLDLLQRMDANSSVLSSIQASAYQDYTGQEVWIPYYYKILYSPKRIDQSVLSLYGVEDTYGGMYSGVSGLSVNYNLLTGTVLKLSDVLTEAGDASQNLLQALLASLEEKKAEFMLFDDYVDTVTNRFQADLYSDSTWYFSTEGLCFFYAPYEIAPNSAGIVVATVPYSALTNILLDAYFPAEQPDFHGEITAAAFEDVDSSDFTNYSVLITDTEASEYIVHTDGILYDIKVEQGSWLAGSLFTPDATVFLANRLSPEDALVLRSTLPETEAALRLSYKCEGKTHSFYLTLDGATGEVVLTSAE